MTTAVRPALAVRGLALRTALAALAVAALPTGAARAAGPGAISGTVAAGGEPVCVLVLDGEGNAITVGASQGTGAYTVSVPAGTWTVEFLPDGGCVGQPSAYAVQYYPGAATRYAATPVTVTAGQTVTGVDAQLAAGASISGTVTDTSGRSLPAVCVILEDGSGRAVDRQPTDSQGNYTIGQLAAASYLVHFVDDGCAGRPPTHEPAYYPNAATAAGAQQVTVGPGRDAGHVDGTLTPMPGSAPQGGTTAGTGAATGASGTTTGGGAASGGGGATPGGGTTASGTSGGRRTGAPGLRRPRAVVALVLPAGGRWTVDAHGRLHLALRCASARSCPVTITIGLPRATGRRLAAGRVLARRRVAVRAGRPVPITVMLPRVRTRRLWIALGVTSGAPELTTVIPVRFARRAR